ncbi:MAG: GerAB/ArcD/ProY family transporter [Lutisporaceae bacterium]
MQRTKITGNQLYSLTANGAFGGSVTVVASAMAVIAKQDAWISALLTPVIGMPVVWIYWYLGSQYPELTFVEIMKKIFGRWIGWVAAASYVFLCLNTACHLPWYVGNFLTTQAMPETPQYVISLMFVTAVVIAVLYGIETIARASEIYIRFVLFLAVLAALLVSPNIKFENLQPVLENGMIPIFKGSYVLSCFTVFPVITMMMIYPANTEKIQEAKKSLFKGLLWAGFITFITILMSILILGSKITASSQYPTYLLAKEIRLGNIFTRLESIVAYTWTITQFMIGLLFFYAGATGLSQLIGLKDHKRIVMPLGLITLVMSGVVFPDVIYQASWVNCLAALYYHTRIDSASFTPSCTSDKKTDAESRY